MSKDNKDEDTFHQLEELMSDYSSEGEDSSEEEEREDLKEIEKSKDFSLEKKDEENLRKRTASIKDKSEKKKRGVIYLGRIPHGFYESQMRKYFSQFGTVTRLKLYRNRKTGRSRHFAFIEFSHEEVAQIVAETMHNYIMCDRLLQCKFIPAEKINPYMWKEVTRRKDESSEEFIKERSDKEEKIAEFGNRFRFSWLRKFNF
ncbi:661_t:CDS:2 [Acaulospora morrowiae]|uniref:661_t:CDS:1 n=1 Tax=Acaulospora morrowiae TaxID=94023 RepID=A0A9N8YPY0_9GLOM|nr:661_t:CDS:2 [Acaulospora morrowiae]